MRRLTVSTNWPTVAEKPERKALYGCFFYKFSLVKYIEKGFRREKSELKDIEDVLFAKDDSSRNKKKYKEQNAHT